MLLIVARGLVRLIGLLLALHLLMGLLQLLHLSLALGWHLGRRALHLLLLLISVLYILLLRLTCNALLVVAG